MKELDTLKCTQFYKLIDYFYPEVSANTGNLGKKGITPSIKSLINPVSVANWFCGDGGKADFTKNEGKGITFHCQAFSKEEQEILCEALKENLGLQAEVKLDNSSQNQWRIDLEGSSYDTFIERVGPYIHQSFKHKLPSPRKNTTFGYLTQELFDKYVGSKAEEPSLIENYRD